MTLYELLNHHIYVHNYSPALQATLEQPAEDATATFIAEIDSDEMHIDIDDADGYLTKLSNGDYEITLQNDEVLWQVI